MPNRCPASCPIRLFRRYGLPAAFSDSDESEESTDSAEVAASSSVANGRMALRRRRNAAAPASPTFARSPSADASMQNGDEAGTSREPGTDKQSAAADSQMFDDDIIELDPALRGAASGHAATSTVATGGLGLAPVATQLPQSQSAAPLAGVAAPLPPLRPMAPMRVADMPAQPPDVSDELLAMAPERSNTARDGLGQRPAAAWPGASEGDVGRRAAWRATQRPLRRPPARAAAAAATVEPQRRGLHPAIAALLGRGAYKPTLLGEMARARRVGFSANGLIAMADTHSTHCNPHTDSAVVAVRQLAVGVMHTRHSSAASASAQELRKWSRERATRLLEVHRQFSCHVAAQGPVEGPHWAFQCTAHTLPCAQLADACTAAADALNSDSNTAAAAPQAAQTERAAAGTFRLLGRLFGHIAPVTCPQQDGEPEDDRSGGLAYVQRKRELSDWLEEACEAEVRAALQEVRVSPVLVNILRHGHIDILKSAWL